MKLDTSVANGRFIVDGVLVDSFGAPAKEEPKPEQSKPQNTSPFPENYPGFSILGAVEDMTPEKLEAMTDDEILAIKDIGPATLKEIRAFQKKT